MKHRRNLKSYKKSRKYVVPNPLFLIVCEGKITEPDYFKSFPYYSKLGKTNKNGNRHSCGSVYIEEGAGQHKALVKNALEKFNKLNNEYGTIKCGDVWCVFDYDNDLSSLKEAVQYAKNKGFNAIYSIQCFELWYLLHFHMLTTAIRNPLSLWRQKRQIDGCFSDPITNVYKLVNALNEAYDNIRSRKFLT